jgi:hypothetical protein
MESRTSRQERQAGKMDPQSSLDGRKSCATSAFHPRFLQKSNRTEQRGKAGDQVNKMARAARVFVNGHELLVCGRPATVIASSLV